MLSAGQPEADHSSSKTSPGTESAFLIENERKTEMKEDDVAVSFYESFIRNKLTLPSSEGGSYELYIIEMPDEEGDEHEIKRTFTVPVSKLRTDKKYEFIRYTYLKKDRQYRVMRSLYDEEQRSTRVEETCQMTGQEIADVFSRFRDRKRKEAENKLTPDDQKEGKK